MAVRESPLSTPTARETGLLTCYAPVFGTGVACGVVIAAPAAAITFA